MFASRRAAIAVMTGMLCGRGLALLARAAPSCALQGKSVRAQLKELRARSIARAIEFVTHYQGTEPHFPLLLDCIRRRFAIPELVGMTFRYDRLLERAQGEMRARLRVLRRVLDHESPLNPADLDAIDINSLDGITARALQCDRVPLEPGFAERLKNAVLETDYGATHVALALLWMRENACTLELGPTFETDLVERMAKLLTLDDRITDVEVESATFLYCMGHGDRVPSVFLDLVVAKQLEGGGWSNDSVAHAGVPHWHTSALALWLLLEAERGTKATMLPR
ncbi:MAG: hypothetical protein U1E76_06290 [Planctomycetota bacterium]